MSAAPDQYQALDSRTATRAGFALPVIHPQVVLVAARYTLGGAIVRDGRTLPIDGFAQHHLHSEEQIF